MQSVSNIKDSAKELKKVGSITGTSMLMALKAVIAQFTIHVSDFLEIGFSNCITGVCGMYYGPILSGIAGVVIDNIEYLLRPTGFYFPGFTLNEFVVGFIYGCFFYKKEITWKRVLVAHLVVALVVNMGLTPLWLRMMYGGTFWAIWTGRIVIQLIKFPIDFAILYVVLKTMSRVRPPKYN